MILLIYICFIQEHWLHSDHVNQVRDISPDFLSVGVSGMNNSDLLLGRPYGGCSILYRKSLSSCIVPLDSCSDRFCGVKFCDSSGLSFLLVSIYMPSVSTPSSNSNYLNVLGELEGFVDSQCCDVNIIVGDFNVDQAELVNDFAAELDLFACDSSFRESVMYTYERDDGTARSWIDHILCSRTVSSLISDVYTLRSDCILSDHYPLCFSLKANCPSIPNTSFTYSKPLRTNWSNVSHSDIEKYNAMVSLVYHLKFLTAHTLIVLSIKMFLTPIVNTSCSPCLPVLLNAFLQFPLPPLGSLLAGLIPLPILREQLIFGINYGTMLVVHHQA